MTLGELIDLLAQQPSDRQVRFSDGTTPGELHSWRGVYAQLTLTADGDDAAAGSLLQIAQDAVGATFTGYKGGQFRMDRDVAVWADDWGQASSYMIVGHEVVDGTLLLTRFMQPSEYDH